MTGADDFGQAALGSTIGVPLAQLKTASDSKTEEMIGDQLSLYVPFLVPP